MMPFDAEQGRPTLRDVARKAGVSAATASRALRGLGKVRADTRERVARAAADLGYVPDPDLGAVARCRHRGRTRHSSLGIAVVVSELPARSRPVERYILGLTRRAERLGMYLEILELPKEGHDLGGVIDVALARGCRALILACQNRAGLSSDEAAACGRLAVVAADYLVREAPVHRVTTDFVHAMRSCWQRAVTAGYRRIGLLLDHHTDRNSDGLWSASYYWCQRECAEGQEALLPVARISNNNCAAVDSWFQAHRPDCIISRRSLRSFFQHRCLTPPRDLGYLRLAVDPTGATSGVVDNAEAVGERMALVVDELLRYRSLGLPRNPMAIILASQWHGGASLGVRS